jgi:predicted nucleic acid-binding protein
MQIENIKSDYILFIRKILDGLNISEEVIAQIAQFNVILDANIIIRDILWLHNKKNPSAKTMLQELFISQTIVAQAPSFLKDEIKKHLPGLAKKKNLNLVSMMQIWEEYEKYINFYEVQIEEHELEDVRDPKDLPYIKLQIATGSKIYSKDKDIPAMGGSTVTTDVIMKLRDYSRKAAIEYTLKIGGIYTAHISEILIKSVWKLLQEIYSGFKNLPKWLRWLLIAMTIFFLINKNSRDTILSIIDVLFSKTNSTVETILKELKPMFIAHEEAQKQALENLKAVEETFLSNK